MKYLGKNGLRVKDDGVWHEGNFDPDNKVDKVSGKGLSTNDYTTTEKNKLAGIENGANKYTHPSTHPYSMITGTPTSLPANGGNADTVGGKRPGDFTLQSYTDSNIYPVNNVAMINLGRPTVTEMALIDSQATNKIWFHPIDKMIFEESDDGITFNERSDISDTNKRKLVSGNSNTSISIPKGKYFRITIFPRSYVYLNWIYMYLGTSGNRARFKCEKKRDDGDWITHFDYTNPVSGWPGHVFIPHSTIAFSPNSTSGHYNQVRITIDAGEQTNTYPNMTLYGLEWWGGYPRGSRDIFSYDEYKNVTFPEELKAKTFKNTSGKEVAYQNDIPTKLSQFNKDINFDERYYTETEVNTKLDGKVDNSAVLTDVPINAKFTDTTYSEITTAEIDAGTASTLRTITGRRVKYIIDKVSTIISTAISGLTKADVGLGNVTNESKTTMFTSPALTGIPKAPTATVGTNTTQIATTAFVQSSLSGAGLGDMLKSVYDTNGNGIVDNAEKVNGFTVGVSVPSNAKFTDTNTITTINGKTGAISKADITALGIPAQDTVYTHPTTHPYSMITGTPTSLPANGGHALSATHLLGDDTRTVNSAPSVYMNGGARYAGRAGWQTEFKNRTAINNPPLSGTYVYLQTHTPWSDSSGGYPIQVVYGNGTPCWRVGVGTSAWSAWQSVNDNGNASTVNGFTVGTNVPSNAKFTDTVYTHPGSGTNPHGTTKANVGLSSVLNYGIATQREAETGTSNAKYMTPLRAKQAISNSPAYHVGKTDTSNKNLLWINTNL